MRKLISVVLVLVACASIAHKPTEVVDLKEVIQRVEKDEAIPQDKKNYFLAELKQAQSVMRNQANYIIQLENEKAELQSKYEDQKILHKKETDSLNAEIKSLSESKGRVKQMDYQFWGFIGLCILALIGVVLYILIKFGNIFSPAKAPSLATELIKKQAGL